ncbi:MAG: serine/threonine protein phosphatase [Burkholderiales bacterium RIFCSPLOWO2_12_FULL_61_40]|nr:MAG: serine/threonine protein phosphatase [Burkholderiales bacterium RIFCSPLOWO2_12_FULL_61_40]
MALAPVFLISILLHALVGWRVAPALFASYAPFGVAFASALTLSALLLPLGVLARRITWPALSELLTWLGLLCMGLFSTLFVLTLLRELLLLGATIFNRLVPAMLSWPAIATDSARALPVLALLATAVGFWNARRTAAVVRVDVPIANLPEALQGFTVAQISDIHVGPTIKTEYLQRIVDRVNRLQADMVAITGDLVDGSVQELRHHVAPLAQLASTHGTFFVTGNHEYYSGAHAWIDVLRGLGVQVLMNEHVVIHHNKDSQDPERAVVVVAGVTDYSAHHFDESHRSDPQTALAHAPALTLFRLLLAHQPRSAPAAAAAGYDLQLSGHTHGGQFWPWGYFVKFQQPFTAGLHKLDSLWVYTSRGTGYWGPPKRFGAPSEITHLRLVRA